VAAPRPRSTICASPGCCCGEGSWTASACSGRKPSSRWTRNQLAAPLYPLRFDAGLFPGDEPGDFVEDGEGYGFGVSVLVEPSATSTAGSAGTYDWSGSWSTDFWVDPAKELIAVFMVQLEPRAFRPLGDEYWSLVCQALID
jgi:CubicO group peptidase (beta-lactamase class C family)